MRAQTLEKPVHQQILDEVMQRADVDTPIGKLAHKLDRHARSLVRSSIQLPVIDGNGTFISGVDFLAAAGGVFRAAAYAHDQAARTTDTLDPNNFNDYYLHQIIRDEDRVLSRGFNNLGGVSSSNPEDAITEGKDVGVAIALIEELKATPRL